MKWLTFKELPLGGKVLVPRILSKSLPLCENFQLTALCLPGRTRGDDAGFNSSSFSGYLFCYIVSLAMILIQLVQLVTMGADPEGRLPDFHGGPLAKPAHQPFFMNSTAAAYFEISDARAS